MSKSNRSRTVTSNRKRPLFVTLSGLAVLVIAVVAGGSMAVKSRSADVKDETPVSTRRSVLEILREEIGDDRPENPEAQIKLTANDARPNDNFGASVAISGDTAIIGAPVNCCTNETNNGAAYIFVRNGASWTFQQKLTSPDSLAGDEDRFGLSVAISGDTVVVGAPRHIPDDEGNRAGAAFIFVRTGTSWALQKKLSPDDTPLAIETGNFGQSVAISGETVLVATAGRIQTSDTQDLVHVFVREDTIWTIEATLTTGLSGNPIPSTFGASVALSGDMAIVGDPRDGGGTQEAAYIFARCAGKWTQQQRLTAGDGTAVRRFGGSVAISGNTVIIGAYGDGLGVNQTQTGSAYVFVSDGTTWMQQQKLTRGAGGLEFGRGVGIFGDTAIIGVPKGSIPAGNQPGSADVFVRSGTTWTRTDPLTASDGQPGDDFGTSVSISGDTVLVGAPLDSLTAQNREGSAWAIDRTTPPPPAIGSMCEEGIIVNSNADTPDPDLTDDVCDINTSTPALECTLRAAIQTANENDGPDTIDFDIPGSGTHTISPGSPFPDITEAAVIDARTQPGYAGTPMIEINGSLAGGGSKGLVFAAGSNASSVHGVTINRFGDIGILIEANNVSVTESYIGLMSDGVGVDPQRRQKTGIKVTGSQNTIGGAYTQSRANSYIAGHAIAEVWISGALAVENQVRGSNIGNDVKNTQPDPGAFDTVLGVRIDAGSSQNRIGGPAAVDGNLISGGYGVLVFHSNQNRILHNVITNCGTGVGIAHGADNEIGGQHVSSDNSGRNFIIFSGFGIAINDGDPFETLYFRRPGQGTSDLAKGPFPKRGEGAIQTVRNKVFGNLIGILPDPNAEDTANEIGILVGTAEETDIGTGQFGFHNFIGKNTAAGIVLNPDANITKVGGNFIGTDFTGQGNAGNDVGVAILGKNSNVFNNVIGFNTDIGITVTTADGASAPVGNVIDNNRIGTNTQGTLRQPNGTGVDLSGGSTRVENNVISANTTFGILVDSDQNIISHNRIGTNAAGNTAFGNDNYGILIFSSTNLVTANTVSGNQTGIEIRARPNTTALARFNTVDKNFIGTNPTGTAPVGNTTHGIVLGNGAVSNFIGTTGTGGGNVISGNTGAGIFLAYTPPGNLLPETNRIQANRIGTNADGTAAIANGSSGILVIGGFENLVGGFGDDIPAARNVISGNGKHGIELIGSTRNRISGNYIGTTSDGASPLGNTQKGIYLASGTNNTVIGGMEPNSGNVISGNLTGGIGMAGDCGAGNLIDPNRIFGNLGPGIDIGDDGHTPNDPADADMGPNNLQNYPTMTLSLSGGDLIVSYQVDSAPAHSAYGSSGIYVEIFEADSEGAGRDFLGSDHYLLSDYNNGTPGTRQKNLGNAAALGIVAGDRLTATATDAQGNTSEFTPAVNAPVGGGSEGDVAPRPTGDGLVLSTDIIQLRRFVTGLDTTNPSTNEFQRADAAPRATLGDGAITSSDVVQGRRYVTGLDPATAVGGPTAPATAWPGMAPPARPFGPKEASWVRIGSAATTRGRQFTVPIELVSKHSVSAISFTIKFDPALVSDPRVSLGRGAPEGTVLTVNAAVDGTLRILADSSQVWTVHDRRMPVIFVTFDLRGGDPATGVISIENVSLSDAEGNELPITWWRDINPRLER